MQNPADPIYLIVQTAAILPAGLNDRATPFLQKPFDIEELARVVNAEAQPR